MNLSIARGDLLDALSIVTKALSSRTTLPILSGILLSAENDGVVLQSTDLEISIKNKVGASVEEAGSVVVPGRLLAEVVRSLPEAKVTLETTSFNQIKVVCEQSSFELKTLSPDDFPKFPEIGAGLNVTLPTATLLSMTRQVSKVVSRDESRPVFTGILLVLEGTTIRMVATDSYRLAIREEKLEKAAEENIEVVIPGKALEEVPKLAASEDAVSMGVSENQIIFEFGSTTYVTRRIEGRFANYQQLVPQDAETHATLNRAELVEATRRVSLLAQHNAALRLALSDNTITLKASTQDVGEASEALMVKMDGPPLEIAFNHAFLLEGISTTEEEELVFMASSPLKPGVFKSVDGERYVYLIMPVRP